MFKRRNERIKFSLPFEIENKPIISGLTLNIGKEGLCIYTKEKLQVLSDQVLSINPSPAAEEKLKVSVKILWSNLDIREDMHLYGARFTKLNQQQKSIIDKIIAYSSPSIIVGSYLPEKVITNQDIINLGLDTTPTVLERSLGAVERRTTPLSETAGDMLTKVGETILKKANYSSKSIDRIICCADPGNAVAPDTATYVQGKLNTTAASFTITMSCVGWVAGVNIAKHYLENGEKKILVLASSQVGSRQKFKDLKHRAIFGDGAGGILIESEHVKRILAIGQISDGYFYPNIFAPHSWSKRPSEIPAEYEGSFYMTPNQKIFFKAMDFYLPRFTNYLLSQANVTLEDIDVFLLHYASKPLYQHSLEILKVPSSKIYHAFEKYGNIAAAEIPVFLDNIINNGMLKEGQLVFVLTYGAGFTMGGLIMRY